MARARGGTMAEGSRSLAVVINADCRSFVTFSQFLVPLTAMKPTPDSSAKKTKPNAELDARVNPCRQCASHHPHVVSIDVYRQPARWRDQGIFCLSVGGLLVLGREI